MHTKADGILDVIINSALMIQITDLQPFLHEKMSLGSRVSCTSM